MNNDYTFQTLNTLESLDYYIAFYIKEKQYAINIKDVLEIINIPDIEIVQVAPEGIIGIFNYKGLMIKVIDICPSLGFTPSEFSINNQLIVVCVEGNCFAIHTESIANILNIHKTMLQPLPFDDDKSIIKYVYKNDNDLVNIIDINILEKSISHSSMQENKINYLELFPKDEKSKQILKLRSNQIPKKQEIFSFSFDQNITNQYIFFSLENHDYCLDIKYVKEFTSIKRFNITKLPYTEDFIKGLINIKGDFLVVVDLKKFLNNNSKNSTESNKLIIVEGKNFNIALLVDEIKYIKSIANVKANRLTDENSKYIFSEFIEDNILYSIINIEKIINDERLYITIE